MSHVDNSIIISLSNNSIFILYDIRMNSDNNKNNIVYQYISNLGNTHRSQILIQLSTPSFSWSLVD